MVESEDVNRESVEVHVKDVPDNPTLSRRVGHFADLTAVVAGGALRAGNG